MNNKKIYLDQDGILTDFMTGVKIFYGIKDFTFPNGVWDWIPIFCEQQHIKQKDFWENLTHHFWANMSWTGDGKQIYRHLIEKVGISNICILSSPANAISAYGKMTWIKREVPELYKIGNFCLNRNKGFIAHAGCILIDDGDHNISSFETAGGKGLLYPRVWNSEHHLAPDCSFDVFVERLDALIEDRIVE